MIGPHIIGSSGDYRELLQRWKPKVALLLDPGERAATEIKSWSPGTFLIGRVYREDGEISDRILADPRSAAEWAADLIRPAASRNPDIDVWQLNNEVVQDADQLPNSVAGTWSCWPKAVCVRRLAVSRWADRKRHPWITRRPGRHLCPP
jgi:hypothetical protein